MIDRVEIPSIRDHDGSYIGYAGRTHVGLLEKLNELIDVVNRLSESERFAKQFEAVRASLLKDEIEERPYCEADVMSMQCGQPVERWGLMCERHRHPAPQPAEKGQIITGAKTEDCGCYQYTKMCVGHSTPKLVPENIYEESERVLDDQRIEEFYGPSNPTPPAEKHCHKWVTAGLRHQCSICDVQTNNPTPAAEVCKNDCPGGWHGTGRNHCYQMFTLELTAEQKRHIRVMYDGCDDSMCQECNDFKKQLRQGGGE